MNTIRLLSVCAAALALSAAPGPKSTAETTAGTSVPGLKSIAPFTYYQEDDLVLVAVDSAFARGHYGDEWIPLDIAVANRALRALSVDPAAGFWLEGPQGEIYPAAPLDVTRRQRLADRFGAEASPFALDAVIHEHFRVYQYGRPNLTGASRGYGRTVGMPKRTFTSGVILFRNPKNIQANAGWDVRPNQRYKLWFTAPELKTPIVVPFAFGP